MMYLTDGAVRKMQALSWQVGGCLTSQELEREAIEWLFQNVACSYAALTDFPAYFAPTRVIAAPSDVDPAELDRTVREHFAEQEHSDHPLVTHYFYEWHALTPLRMSDLLSDRQLRSTRVYSQVFRPYGVTHQIALVSRRVSPYDNAGYTIMRQGNDFNDEELALAIGLQPILFALHQAIRARSRPDADPAAANRHGLTPAETDVLTLVAAGMTAVAIGHARGTSPRTVRKQLDSIYDKLGRHDRLQATLYARATGILPDARRPADIPQRADETETPNTKAPDTAVRHSR